MTFSDSAARLDKTFTEMIARCKKEFRFCSKNTWRKALNIRTTLSLMVLDVMDITTTLCNRD